MSNISKIKTNKELPKVKTVKLGTREAAFEVEYGLPHIHALCVTGLASEQSNVLP